MFNTSVNKLFSLSIYTSFISFFVPFIGGKSITICELLYPFISYILLVNGNRSVISLTRLQSFFALTEITKIISSTYIVTSLRSFSYIFFIISTSRISIDESIIKKIGKSIYIVLWMVFVSGLINFILGNSIWSSILREFNLLPLNISEAAIRSWWNNENGIISFFPTQNALSQYTFLSYQVLRLIDQSILNNYSKNLTIPMIISLILCKTSLSLFGVLLIIGQNLPRYNNTIKDFIFRLFKNLRIRVKDIIIVFIITIISIYIYENLFYRREINEIFSFANRLYTLNQERQIDIFSFSSGGMRLNYLKQYIETISHCRILGDSGISQVLKNSPHNYYLFIVHSYGWLTLTLYMFVLAQIVSNGIRNTRIKGTTITLFLYMLLGGLQGNLFNDSRLITPFLIYTIVLRYNKLKTIDQKPEFSR